MPTISEETRQRLIEIGAALAIGLAFFLLSFTTALKRLELLSLDARFNLRPPIVTNRDMATIDIDNRALEEEGRWQDWTRDRHGRTIDLVRRGGGALLGFDIYFSEESEQILRPSNITNAQTIEDVHAAFRDYDAELTEAARRAGNIFWGATFVLEESDRYGKKPPEPSVAPILGSSWQNFGNLIERGFCLPAEGNEVASILRATAPQAIPIPTLVDVARGVGFAQIRREADGVVRMYPTFIRCDYPPKGDDRRTYLFPSIGLTMACDYLQVSLQNVIVKPGQYVEIPNAYLPDGSKKDLRIPINDAGEMIINWAGDYEDTFNHFPYSSLAHLGEQKTLEEIKAFLSRQDPAIFQSPGELMTAVHKAFPSAPDFSTYVAYLYGAHWYETLLEAGQIEEFEPSLFETLFGLSPEDSPELFESQRSVFDNVCLNRAMQELLSQSPDTSLEEAIEILEAPSVVVEQSYMTISQLLARGGPQPSDRPMFFLPPVTIEGKYASIEDLRGGVFFCGLTAAGTHDLNPMPFSPRYPMVGALANVFNTIVTDQFITAMPAAWRLPLFLIVGLCAGYILSSSSAIRGSIFTLLFLLAYLLLVYYLFVGKRMWIDVVGPAATVLLSDAAVVWHKFNAAEKKRKFIRSAFEHYMNPAVVAQITKNPEMLELGGKELELSALFSDVAGFTTISEQLTPHQLVELLNDYLTEMTDIVLKHFGNLDKYEGDAIMAFFGAPIHFPDHASRACHTALEMQEVLGRLRERWKAEGRPEMRARVGINTGPMVVGNMGSRTRFDYTVMGDAVNLASRLEGVNKQYGTDIMISEFTLAHCKEDFVVREIDLIRVKGKTEPVRIYEVVARADDSLSDIMETVIEHYANGLDAYRHMDWKIGMQEFQKALDISPNDGPSLTYLKRCQQYLETPPPDDWDGVYVMTTK